MSAIKAPSPGVRVTVEKFLGVTRIFTQIDIHCRDTQQVDAVGDLLIGEAETEKRTAESTAAAQVSNAGK